MIQQQQFQRVKWSALWVVALLIALIPVSSESIWMGESLTFHAANQESLGDALSSMDEVTWMKQYMAGYTFYTWAWDKIFGSSEWAIRMSNWPWLVLLLMSLYILPLPRFQRIFLLIAYTFHPFVWLHMDEAKPSIILMACTGIALHGLIMYFYGTGTTQKRGRWMLIASVFVGVSTHSLFVLAGVPLVFVLVWHVIAKRNISIGRVTDSAILLGALVAAGIFWGIAYWQQWTWDWTQMDNSNVIYTLYEFVGCAGLGPPWKSIVRAPHFALFQPYFPQVLPVIGIFGLIALLGIFKAKKWATFRSPWLWASIVGFGMILVLMMGFNFRFWGRHLAFLFPFFLMFLSDILQKSNRLYPYLTRGLIGGLLILWILSSMHIRFDPAFEKGAYREATTMAQVLATQYQAPIYWTGDQMTGQYYGLDFFEIEKKAMRSLKGTQAVQLENYYPSIESDLSLSSDGVLVWFDYFNNFDRNQALAFALARRGGVLIHQAPSYKIYKLGTVRPASLSQLQPQTQESSE
ncbi:MAG: hypothetical protein AAFV25_17150 [Bacteroidota bacterium]